MLGRTPLPPQSTPLQTSSPSHNNPNATRKPHLAFKVNAAAPSINIESTDDTNSSRTFTPYQILRVQHNASSSEIKAAYRSLAKMYHPDVASSNSQDQHFIEIRNAYVTLSDPVARANYDLSINPAAAANHKSDMSGSYTFPGFGTSRKWETDQCW